jgi:hypothetical protein
MFLACLALPLYGAGLICAIALFFIALAVRKGSR